jgi:hypothetical protein
MASSYGNNGVLFALVAGGVLYYLYQKSQALAAQYGVANDIQGDIEQFSQNVTNTVENATIGSTRGERNNNPGNIRHNPKYPAVPDPAWQGMSSVQTDSSFLQFDDVLHGIRAMHVNLNTYFTKYGLNTVSGIIQKWAPASDHNATASYIAFVANSMGVDPNAQLDLSDLTTMTALVHAIIMRENGSDPYLSTGQLQQAMALT